MQLSIKTREREHDDEVTNKYKKDISRKERLEMQFLEK